jgi:hypothetical protein
MDLVAVEGESAQPAYEMKLMSTPDIIEAGKPVTLSFTPTLPGDSASQVPLDEVHEHKIHVIIVSNDLGWYDHVHPVYQADGSYTIEKTFPAGGEYIVFSDFQPTGAGNQVYRSTIAVNGNVRKKESFTTENLIHQTDGYEVKLVPVGGTFMTNNLNHMGVEVTRNGAPVTDFETIMGAKGHLVIISGDGQKYLHVHPEEVDGKLDLHTRFEQTGIHRAYFQFQTDGKLHTSYFTIDVKEGQAGEMESHEGHDHDHGDGEEHSH